MAVCIVLLSEKEEAALRKKVLLSGYGLASMEGQRLYGLRSDTKFLRCCVFTEISAVDQKGPHTTHKESVCISHHTAQKPYQRENSLAR